MLFSTLKTSLFSLANSVVNAVCINVVPSATYVVCEVLAATVGVAYEVLMVIYDPREAFASRGTVAVGGALTRYTVPGQFSSAARSSADAVVNGSPSDARSPTDAAEANSSADADDASVKRSSAEAHSSTDISSPADASSATRSSVAATYSPDHRFANHPLVFKGHTVRYNQFPLKGRRSSTQEPKEAIKKTAAPAIQQEYLVGEDFLLVDYPKEAYDARIMGQPPQEITSFVNTKAIKKALRNIFGTAQRMKAY